ECPPSTISRRYGDEYTGAMKPAGAVLLHGYGVRGYIWGPMQAALDDRLGPIATPDLEAPSVAELVNKAKARVRRHSLECDAPVAVVGHSLGAVLAAIAARDLGPEIVSAAVMLAPPFGDRGRVPGKFLQFLFRRRLIPSILLRPRFFSSLTPRTVRRAVFRAAVPESPGIQSLIFEPHWFHSGFFSVPLQQPSLVIASPADRIVPLSQSEEFARTIGARTHLFEEAAGVAHDDLFASPEIASTVAELMINFIASA
ncbi:MAG: alpha/beta fold hydrolase, partial [Spirochaetia bacterium]